MDNEVMKKEHACADKLGSDGHSEGVAPTAAWNCNLGESPLGQTVLG